MNPITPIVETSQTGDIRVEHRPRYNYPIRNIVATAPSLRWWYSYNTTR